MNQTERRSRKKYKNTTCAMIKQQIKLSKKEHRDITKQFSTLKIQNNDDKEQLYSVQEKIQSLKSKLKDIQNNIDKLNTEKNEIIALDSLIDDYSNLENELTNSITDIKSFFDSFTSHPEKVFFSCNTESTTFPNFSSLLTNGKSLSSLKAEEDFCIHN